MVTVALSAPSLNEVEIVQNPALGAYAIWRFGLGFQSEDSRPAAFPLAFLVLPLVLHRPTLGMISSTQRASGLALFAAKLSHERENLLAVHERALALRRLTLQSIAMGIGERLLTLDYVSTTIRANTPDSTIRIRNFAGAADKVGYWCSKLSLHQVASTLAVEF